MNYNPYICPKFNTNVFSCPYCKEPTSQHWLNCAEDIDIFGGEEGNETDITFSQCIECKNLTIWVNEKLVYPFIGVQPPPHPDMPENIRSIYEEAASISHLSPRASCALMRYAIEELIKDLGYWNKTLFDTINQLNERDKISTAIKEGLNIVRLAGNQSMHSKEIIISDSTQVDDLFILINHIIIELISEPKRIESLLSKFKSRLEPAEKRGTK